MELKSFNDLVSDRFGCLISEAKPEELALLANVRIVVLQYSSACLNVVPIIHVFPRVELIYFTDEDVDEPNYEGYVIPDSAGVVSSSVRQLYSIPMFSEAEVSFCPTLSQLNTWFPALNAHSGHVIRLGEESRACVRVLDDHYIKFFDHIEADSFCDPIVISAANIIFSSSVARFSDRTIQHAFSEFMRSASGAHKFTNVVVAIKSIVQMRDLVSIASSEVNHLTLVFSDASRMELDHREVAALITSINLSVTKSFQVIDANGRFAGAVSCFGLQRFLAAIEVEVEVAYVNFSDRGVSNRAKFQIHDTANLSLSNTISDVTTASMVSGFIYQNGCVVNPSSYCNQITLGHAIMLPPAVYPLRQQRLVIDHSLVTNIKSNQSTRNYPGIYSYKKEFVLKPNALQWLVGINLYAKLLFLAITVEGSVLKDNEYAVYIDSVGRWFLSLTDATQSYKATVHVAFYPCQTTLSQLDQYYGVMRLRHGTVSTNIFNGVQLTNHLQLEPSAVMYFKSYLEVQHQQVILAPYMQRFANLHYNFVYHQVDLLNQLHRYITGFRCVNIIDPPSSEAAIATWVNAFLRNKTGTCYHRSLCFHSIVNALRSAGILNVVVNNYIVSNALHAYCVVDIQLGLEFFSLTIDLGGVEASTPLLLETSNEVVDPLCDYDTLDESVKIESVSDKNDIAVKTDQVTSVCDSALSLNWPRKNKRCHSYDRVEELVSYIVTALAPCADSQRQALIVLNSRSELEIFKKKLLPYVDFCTSNIEDCNDETCTILDGVSEKKHSYLMQALSRKDALLLIDSIGPQWNSIFDRSVSVLGKNIAIVVAIRSELQSMRHDFYRRFGVRLDNPSVDIGYVLDDASDESKGTTATFDCDLVGLDRDWQAALVGTMKFNKGIPVFEPGVLTQAFLHHRDHGCAVSVRIHNPPSKNSKAYATLKIWLESLDVGIAKHHGQVQLWSNGMSLAMPRSLVNVNMVHVDLSYHTPIHIVRYDCDRMLTQNINIVLNSENVDSCWQHTQDFSNGDTCRIVTRPPGLEAYSDGACNIVIEDSLSGQAIMKLCRYADDHNIKIQFFVSRDLSLPEELNYKEIGLSDRDVLETMSISKYQSNKQALLACHQYIENHDMENTKVVALSGNEGVNFFIATEIDPHCPYKIRTIKPTPLLQHLMGGGNVVVYGSLSSDAARLLATWPNVKTHGWQYTVAGTITGFINHMSVPSWFACHDKTAVDYELIHSETKPINNICGEVSTEKQRAISRYIADVNLSGGTVTTDALSWLQTSSDTAVSLLMSNHGLTASADVLRYSILWLLSCFPEKMVGNSLCFWQGIFYSLTTSHRILMSSQQKSSKNTLLALLSHQEYFNHRVHFDPVGIHDSDVRQFMASWMHQRSCRDLIITPRIAKLIKKIESMLLFNERRNLCYGAVVTGIPGLGKSAFLLGYLRWKYPDNYLILPVGNENLMLKVLSQAIARECILFIDEINTLQHYPIFLQQLSEYLTFSCDGVFGARSDEHPGLRILATQNPITFKGREQLPSFLRQRLYHFEFVDYNRTELKLITAVMFSDLNDAEINHVVEGYLDNCKTHGKKFSDFLELLSCRSRDDLFLSNGENVSSQHLRHKRQRYDHDQKNPKLKLRRYG